MKRFVFSLGSAGHAILDNLFAIYFLFFLLPPAESGLAERVSNQNLWWGLTVAGSIVLFGRLADAVFDPLVAQWSDLRRGRLGRRRFFLVTGPLPFVALTVLLFLPPVSGPTVVNVVWELAALAAFFVFYTWYLVPYLALIGEISATHDERIALTTVQAAMSLAGALLVMLGLPLLWEALGSFVGAVVLCAVVALPLLLAPAAVVREQPPETPSAPSPTFWHSITTILGNRPFLLYLGAKVRLFTAFNIMRAIVAYYPVVLLDKPQSFQTLLLGAAFGSGALCFVLVKSLSHRVSNKALMASALLAFALLLPLCLLIGHAGAWAVPLALTQMMLLGWPVAVLLGVPNALVADLAGGLGGLLGLVGFVVMLRFPQKG